MLRAFLVQIRRGFRKQNGGSQGRKRGTVHLNSIV
jgi:hypothetical protein